MLGEETDTELTLGLRRRKNMVYSKHCNVEQEREGTLAVSVDSQTLSSTTQLQARLEIWEEEALGVCWVITEGSQIRIRFGECVFGGTWGR